MSRGSNWSRQHQSDEDFTRAAWDNARDAEISCRAGARVVLRLSEQRGVWVARSELVGPYEGAQARLWARTESSYPNARALSLASFLFQQTNSLAIMADNAYQDAIKEALRRK